MSVAIEILRDDRAITDMQRLAARVESQDLDAVIGEAVVDTLRMRFAALDSERPNQLGGDRTHFYGDCADMTSWTYLPDGVLVSVTKEGIRTRIMGTGYLPGGAILPVNAEKLAIPAIAEAYGHAPAEFEDLVPLYRRRDGKAEVFALAQDAEEADRPRRFRKRDETIIDWNEQENRIFFWLVDSVVQEPDDTILPGEDEVRARAYHDLDDYFAAIQGQITYI